MDHDRIDTLVAFALVAWETSIQAPLRADLDLDARAAIREVCRELVGYDRIENAVSVTVREGHTRAFDEILDEIAARTNFDRPSKRSNPTTD